MMKTYYFISYQGLRPFYFERGICSLRLFATKIGHFIYDFRVRKQFKTESQVILSIHRASFLLLHIFQTSQGRYFPISNPHLNIFWSQWTFKFGVDLLSDSILSTILPIHNWRAEALSLPNSAENKFISYPIRDDRGTALGSSRATFIAVFF